MKKALLAGLICAGVTITRSSYGSGNVLFDNYVATPYMPIEYLGTQVGVADSNFHVDLLYAFGTQSTTNGMLDTGLSVAINPIFVDGFGNHGYFSDNTGVTIPGYSSGPISFDVVCWLTANEGHYFGFANYGAAVAGAGGAYGQSAVWTESSITTGLPPANPFAGLPGPNGAALLYVPLVPEPSILVLTGLCFAALALRRRHKK